MRVERWNETKTRLRRLFAGANGDTRDSGGSDPVRPAAVASRSAALLRGGISPRRMVDMLHRDLPGDEMQTVAESVAAGASIGSAFASIDGQAWRVLGVAWNLAEASGAPLASSLERISEALHSIEELGRRREVLLATPRMTVKLVAFLPLAALGVGYLLGFDPLSVFLTPFGAALLGSGLAMQAAGMMWVRRLITRVEQEDRVAGLECELVWIALAGGAPPGRARIAVVDAVAEADAEWIEYASFCRGRALDRALTASIEAGVPASALLVESARDERLRTQSRLEQEAERLSVRILVPLAVCILPAFVVLGVVPVIVKLFGDVFVF